MHTDPVSQSQMIEIRKRDGSKQMFTRDKIANAVAAAWKSVGGFDEDKTKIIAMSVASDAFGAAEAGVIDIEEVQNLVEIALMRNKLYDVAKAYVIYRQSRAVARGARKHPDPRAVADYIHAAKYARYLPDKKRREVYEETVARTEQMHIRRFGHLPSLAGGDSFAHDIRRAFDLVREERVLPSMRSMQFGGAAIEAVENRIYNCSATHVNRLEAFSQAFYLLLCGCGVGYSVQFRHVDQLPEFGFVDPKRVVHHVVGDSIEGWADAALALLRSFVDGTHIEFAYHLVRSEGSPLKTSGGKAPGHLALKTALESVRTILLQAQGRRLRPIECHEIMCLLADAVLSGGIRRSSLISLFSLEDSEMMYCKTGNWLDKKPWLSNANNSCVLKRSEVRLEQFMRIFKMTKRFGEPGFIFVNDEEEVTNPCQPRWATVLTPEGIKTIGEIEIGSTIWSGKQWTKVTNKWSTGVKPVYAFRTRAGTFYGTENHRVVSEGEKIEVGQAESIDTAQGPVGAHEDLDPRVIMDGIVFGDGSVHEASNNLVHLYIGAKDGDYLDSEISHLLKMQRPRLSEHAWEIRTSLTAAELPKTYLRSVPHRFRFGSSAHVRAFLRGLYTANGSIVSTRVTLKAASIQVIRQVQEMLSSLGISSYYTTNAAHTVQFDNGEYECRESYDLNITGGRREFQRQIGFIQKDKQRRLSEICEIPARESRAKKTFEIIEQTFISEEEVFDLTVEADEHTYWTGGLLVSNCAEIRMNCRLQITHEVLRLLKERTKRGKPMPDVKLGEVYTGFSFCNLCEINASKISSFSDFVEAAHAAALIGTLQASYTNMPYLGWVSEVIAEREALLGVGMTGMMDSPDYALNPEHQREIAGRIVEWNAEYAELIGIRPAARTTTVKPGGTTSLKLGVVPSGIHPQHARRFLRLVTANELETVFQNFKSVNPHMCVRKPDGDWVIEFPVQARDGAKVKRDFTAVQFLEVVKSTQQNWVEPGTARPESSPGYVHNVSNTVQVEPHEWGEVAEYLWQNKEHFSGVSFIENNNKIYPFMPFQEVITEADEAHFNQLVANYKPVDYLSFVEEDDTTSFVQEPACAGGACEIPTR
jgi:hypothetical protein